MFVFVVLGADGFVAVSAFIVGVFAAVAGAVMIAVRSVASHGMVS
jgi:hypothetical protein